VVSGVKILARVAVCAGLALLSGGPADGSQISLPSVDITIDQNSVMLPENIISSGLQDGGWLLSGQVQTADYDATFNVTADPDPFITYSFTVNNTTGRPLAVSEDYSIPVAGGLWDYATASVSLAAVGGRNGFDIEETPGSNALQTATAGPGAFDLNVGLGGSCQGSRGAHSCYALATSASFAAQYFTTLSVHVSFTLNGLGSGATVSGRVEITDFAAPATLEGVSAPLPEPGTLAGTGAALTLLAAVLGSRRGSG